MDAVTDTELDFIINCLIQMGQLKESRRSIKCRKVACGSFSDVYQIDSHHRSIALKICSLEDAEGFQTNSTHTPWFPELYYCGEIEGFWVSLEEWINGSSLFDLAKNREADYLYLLSRVVLPLIEACLDLESNYRLLHGDITPKNVIVSTSGNNTSLKLIDPDPQYAISDDGTISTSVVSGSMTFMAPEHLRGEKKLSAKKELSYMVGSNIYYLFHGYPPYCESFPKHISERLAFGPRGDRKSREKQEREDYKLWMKHLENNPALFLEANANNATKLFLKKTLSLQASDRASLEEVASLLLA